MIPDLEGKTKITIPPPLTNVIKNYMATSGTEERRQKQKKKTKKGRDFSGLDLANGSGQQCFKRSRVGSVRVASESVLNITGRVVSGQEVFKYDGSGRVTQTGSDLRELIRPATKGGRFWGIFCPVAWGHSRR